VTSVASSATSESAATLDGVDLELAFALAQEKAHVAQALLDATREAIWMTDMQGTIVIQNEPAKRLLRSLFGCSDDAEPEESINSITDQVSEPEEYIKALSHLTLDVEAEQDFVWTHKGTGRVFNRYSGPVRNQNGSPIGRVFLTREITLERENERLKDEFIALVSHELRTPLTSMVGFIDLMRDDETGPLNPEQKHFLNTLERNTFRLQRIVADLLFVSQSAAGRIALERTSCDLGEVARQCVEAAAPVADAREITLKLVIETEPTVYGDRERLSQVLDNLITNALKFTDREGEVAVYVGIKGDEAIMAVADTGMGMSEDEQKKLFQKFYRTDRATELAIQGTGLGLAICKTIVEKHHGRIGVQSEENVGSTFSVHLPLHREPEAN
jgi:signal transduction histidine kinase